MAIRTYKVSELKDRVTLDLGLILYGDLYSFLGLDRASSIKNFSSLIRQAINEYSDYRAVVLSKLMPDNKKYEFKDNFKCKNFI